MMTDNNKHPLWNEPMEEAETFFSYYYNETSNDIAEDDHELWSIYIKEFGKEHAILTSKQLTQIIESDMEDQEIEDFIYKKLGSDFLARPGESRQWLIEVSTYLKDNT